MSSGDAAYMLFCNIVGVTFLILGFAFNLSVLLGLGVGIFIGMIFIQILKL